MAVSLATRSVLVERFAREAARRDYPYPVQNLKGYMGGNRQCEDQGVESVKF